MTSLLLRCDDRRRTSHQPDTSEWLWCIMGFLHTFMTSSACLFAGASGRAFWERGFARNCSIISNPQICYEGSQITGYQKTPLESF